mmetsp:Transcript_13006/g.46193  ORF Transcript_13006/g.46193 Transcript_13006/m.46193 type:complete len:278 (-) Transcript_13006:1406-2239(-)
MHDGRGLALLASATQVAVGGPRCSRVRSFPADGPPLGRGDPWGELLEGIAAPSTNRRGSGLGCGDYRSFSGLQGLLPGGARFLFRCHRQNLRRGSHSAPFGREADRQDARRAWLRGAVERGDGAGLSEGGPQRPSGRNRGALPRWAGRREGPHRRRWRGRVARPQALAVPPLAWARAPARLGPLRHPVRHRWLHQPARRQRAPRHGARRLSREPGALPGLWRRCLGAGGAPKEFDRGALQASGPVEQGTACRCQAGGSPRASKAVRQHRHHRQPNQS